MLLGGGGGEGVQRSWDNIGVGAGGGVLKNGGRWANKVNHATVLSILQLKKKKG